MRCFDPQKVPETFLFSTANRSSGGERSLLMFDEDSVTVPASLCVEGEQDLLLLAYFDLKEEKMEGDTQIDGKVIQTFQKNFGQVQNILDQNRLLINEINQNHESKIPNNLSKNIGLIRELNNNIRRVVDLYADISTSLSIKSVDDSSEGDSSGYKRSRPI
ncbi:Protein ELF4-LIKE 3 [Datura stramonium]|uniref:Protein ELF4-LIKE 3 n=1 Tax=Datura stramonium TaxID=4076 RepID=A0ABS8WID4_DATST|nr:Protein ELF4-LIKE 3 [Datura stramonium]